MMRAKQREKERKAAELAAALKSSKNKEQVRVGSRVRGKGKMCVYVDCVARLSIGRSIRPSQPRAIPPPPKNSCWP